MPTQIPTACQRDRCELLIALDTANLSHRADMPSRHTTLALGETTPLEQRTSVQPLNSLTFTWHGRGHPLTSRRAMSSPLWWEAGSATPGACLEPALAPGRQAPVTPKPPRSAGACLGSWEAHSSRYAHARLDEGRITARQQSQVPPEQPPTTAPVASRDPPARPRTAQQARGVPQQGLTDTPGP
jgi:hypothetical protein